MDAETGALLAAANLCEFVNKKRGNFFFFFFFFLGNAEKGYKDNKKTKKITADDVNWQSEKVSEATLCRQFNQTSH